MQIIIKTTRLSWAAIQGHHASRSMNKVHGLIYLCAAMHVLISHTRTLVSIVIDEFVNIIKYS